MIDIISKSRINNIPLDISREDLFKLDYSVEQFRIGFSQNNQFVRSISVIATDAFRIDGELVKLSQMTEWYRKENPLVDGNSYIFPNKNLAIWDSNGMFEITLYSNKEKDLYERDLGNLSTYNTYTEIKHLPDTLLLIPYVGLNILELGCNAEKVHQILGKPLYAGQRNGGAFDNGAYIEKYHNLALRYDDNVLTEIHFSDMPNIYYDEMNLATPKILLTLKKKYNIIPKWSYSVIPELGITLGKMKSLFILNELRNYGLTLKDL